MAVLRLSQYKIQLSARDLLIVTWVLMMIALPILRWVVGDQALVWGVTLTTLFQFGAVAITLLKAWGGLRLMRVLGLVAVLTFLAEFIGSHTGLPFGEYHYTDFLQPQIGGVPVLIPLAWFMMLPPAWAVAQAITRHRWAFYLVSAAAFTAWDLFLDPQNVAWGLWVWADSSGGYFGIPWLNYLGWLLVSYVVTRVVNPAAVPIKPLLVIYGIVWSFQAMGQVFFWGLVGPGIVGFLVMGAFVGLAAWRLPSQAG